MIFYFFVFASWYLFSRLDIANVSNKFTIIRSLVLESICILAVCFVFGVISSLFSITGLFAYPKALEDVYEKSLVNNLPEIGTDEMKRLRGGFDTVVIDARATDTFQRGHIANAINIPTEMSEENLGFIIGHIKKSSKIIVYCQNEKCPYARIIAAYFIHEGFLDICIYKGGWVEWELSNHDLS